MRRLHRVLPFPAARAVKHALKIPRGLTDTGGMIRRRIPHSARFEAYKTFHADLSRALDAESQSWMGQAGETLRDRNEASRLTFDLTRTTSRAELAWTLRRVFGRHSPFLVDRVANALDRFRTATGLES